MAICVCGGMGGWGVGGGTYDRLAWRRLAEMATRSNVCFELYSESKFTLQFSFVLVSIFQDL